MNIKDIDLEAISAKLLADQTPTEKEIEMINKIFFGCSVEKVPEADVIIVLGGSMCNDRIQKGIEIMKECDAKFIIPTGGVASVASKPTEAVQMYDTCIKNGIPPEKIILENQATTTRENIIFSSILVSRLNLVAPKVVIVSSASHMRRVRMCCTKIKNIFPDDAEIIYAHSSPEVCRPDTWYTTQKGRSVIGREFQLLHRYLYKYDCEAFEI